MTKILKNAEVKNSNFRLGREIKISPKSSCLLFKPFSVDYAVDMVVVIIGIGKDHTAELSMTKDAWQALNLGEEISIMTTKENKL